MQWFLRFAFSAGFLCLGFLTVSARADIEMVVPVSVNATAVNWDQLINQGGAQAVFFGVELAGPSPYSRNSGSSFEPASTSKLFTTAAALTLLGPQYRIESTLEWYSVNGENEGVVTALTLAGAGDPTWGMSEFGEALTTKVDEMAQTLRDRGVQEVRGEVRVVAQDARWDQLSYPVGWATQDRTACYGALSQAVNLDINCAEYVVRSAHQGHWSDPSVAIPVRLRISSGSETSLRVRSIDRPGRVTAEFEMSGTWRSGSASVSFYLPVHDSKERVRRLLVEALARKGIRVSDMRAEPGEKSQLSFYSPELRELIRPFMKMSFNGMGDALFKIMAHKFGPKELDLVSAGQQVMREFIETLGTLRASAHGQAARPGFFSSQVEIYDGSGVSRASHVTTGAMMALLDDCRVRSDFPDLWDSLSIAGVDGTLKDRMRGSAAAGLLRAKTGTLSGVYNLAGFVPRVGADGNYVEFVPFVLLSKTRSGLREEARAAEDRVGAALSELVNRNVEGAPLR